MKKLTLSSLLISMAFFLFSCGGETKEAQAMSEMINDEDMANVEEVIIVSNEESPLIGQNFGLILEGQPWANYVGVVEQSPYFVIFSSDEGSLSLSGSAGCNNIIGTVNLNEEEGTISFVAGSTMMACDEQIMELEYKFLNALTETQSYILEDDTLILMDNSGNILATFMPY